MHLVDAATGMCEQGALFQQLELLEDLMQREQIVGRTHVATVRGCNAHGLVVDVLIVDNSRLSPMTYDFNYRDENDPENYYCWRNALISWTVFPNALFGDTTDMEELAKVRVGARARWNVALNDSLGHLRLCCLLCLNPFFFLLLMTLWR